MSLALPLVVEPLAQSHEHETFDHGIPVFNDYLRRQAMQDVRRGVSRVYVARNRGSSKVLGYYT